MLIITSITDNLRNMSKCYNLICQLYSLQGEKFFNPYILMSVFNIFHKLYDRRDILLFF